MKKQFKIASTLSVLIAAFSLPQTVALANTQQELSQSAIPASANTPNVMGPFEELPLEAVHIVPGVQTFATSVCTASIDYPHISGTRGVTYTVNVHLDGKCRAIPSKHNISGDLSRSRWYGWERLNSKQRSFPGKSKARLTIESKCKPGSMYKYRANGRFYALIGKASWVRSFYNQNPREIRCTRSA